jgi:putative membrane protein
LSAWFFDSARAGGDLILAVYSFRKSLPFSAMKSARLTLALAAAFSMSAPLHGADEGKIGKTTIAEFAKATDAAMEQIKAVKANAGTLVEADQKALSELATSVAAQLECGKAAVERLESTDMKAFAKGEVVEYTELSAKLKEIAAAKSFELPSKLPAKQEKDVADFKAKSGKGFDAAYLNFFAVQANQELWALMTRVEKDAKDEDLKELVKAALPVVRMHTKTAKAEMADDD